MTVISLVNSKKLRQTNTVWIYFTKGCNRVGWNTFLEKLGVGGVRKEPRDNDLAPSCALYFSIVEVLGREG